MKLTYHTPQLDIAEAVLSAHALQSISLTKEDDYEVTDEEYVLTKERKDSQPDDEWEDGLW